MKDSFICEFLNGKLSPMLMQQMYLLYSKYYQDRSEVEFIEDLQPQANFSWQKIGKQTSYDLESIFKNQDYKTEYTHGFTDMLIVRKEETKEIIAFTTFKIQEAVINDSNYIIISNGDTVIDEKYWSHQDSLLKYGTLLYIAKVFEFISFHLPHYCVLWFVLSESYKTFMVMTKYFLYFIPKNENRTKKQQIYQQLDSCYRYLSYFYGSDEMKVLPNGICIIEYEKGDGFIKNEVKEKVLQQARKTKENWEVDFFLQYNPHFDQGNFLCGVAFVDIDTKEHITNTVQRKLHNSYYIALQKALLKCSIPVVSSSKL